MFSYISFPQSHCCRMLSNGTKRSKSTQCAKMSNYEILWNFSYLCFIQSNGNLVNPRFLISWNTLVFKHQNMCLKCEKCFDNQGRMYYIMSACSFCVPFPNWEGCILLPLFFLPGGDCCILSCSRGKQDLCWKTLMTIIFTSGQESWREAFCKGMSY